MRSVSRTAGLALVAIAWALVLALSGSPEALLFTVPVFLLAAPLAFGRYVGEDIIVALRARKRHQGRSVPVVGLSVFDRVPVLAPVAFRLSARGPPAISH